ncbi:mycothiol system anti-sigma-R factor [Auraticoccus monumenti]|uniref:Mycothiol system anti-sigma-R factor n=1 Tax=Auraticoccus monumenti TaxID=675864 RepID=A0A1G7AUN4_9ACTN|nr:mycothiol system anti-sigma-R factor [Auraticoccus monumenti]SDE18549.1 mycothiol system anti-sigma-R factor [Auraticoccus monumenti]
MSGHVHEEHTFSALVGADGEVHCAEVLQRVHVFIDHEIDGASADTIRRHLSDCEPCLDQFDVAEAVKQLVHRCCSGEQAPDALRRKVLQVLGEETEGRGA